MISLACKSACTFLTCSIAASCASRSSVIDLCASASFSFKISPFAAFTATRLFDSSRRLPKIVFCFSTLSSYAVKVCIWSLILTLYLLHVQFKLARSGDGDGSPSVPHCLHFRTYPLGVMVTVEPVVLSRTKGSLTRCLGFNFDSVLFNRFRLFAQDEQAIL